MSPQDRRAADGLVVQSLGEFFRTSVTDAMRNQRLETSQETEFYLVNLLETFSKAEQLHGPADDPKDEPLALVLSRAVESSPESAIPLYRRIGDEALYMSGFFSQRLERKHVSQRYYRALGTNAYETLAALMHAKRDQVFTAIFGELAGKFPELVEVLIEISESHDFHSASGQDALMDRWLVSNSTSASKRLVREGYLLTWRGDSDDESN